MEDGRRNTQREHVTTELEINALEIGVSGSIPSFNGAVAGGIKANDTARLSPRRAGAPATLGTVAAQSIHLGTISDVSVACGQSVDLTASLAAAGLADDHILALAREADTMLASPRRASGALARTGHVSGLTVNTSPRTVGAGSASSHSPRTGRMSPAPAPAALSPRRAATAATTAGTGLAGTFFAAAKSPKAASGAGTSHSKQNSASTPRASSNNQAGRRSVGITPPAVARSTGTTGSRSAASPRAGGTASIAGSPKSAVGSTSALSGVFALSAAPPAAPCHAAVPDRPKSTAHSVFTLGGDAAAHQHNGAANSASSLQQQNAGPNNAAAAAAGYSCSPRRSPSLQLQSPGSPVTATAATAAGSSSDPLDAALSAAAKAIALDGLGSERLATALSALRERVRGATAGAAVGLTATTLAAADSARSVDMRTSRSVADSAASGSFMQSNDANGTQEEEQHHNVQVSPRGEACRRGRRTPTPAASEASTVQPAASSASLPRSHNGSGSSAADAGTPRPRQRTGSGADDWRSSLGVATAVARATGWLASGVPRGVVDDSNNGKSNEPTDNASERRQTQSSGGGWKFLFGKT
jgi:hypothetical protein